MKSRRGTQNCSRLPPAGGVPSGPSPPDNGSVSRCSVFNGLLLVFDRGGYVPKGFGDGSYPVDSVYCSTWRRILHNSYRFVVKTPYVLFYGLFGFNSLLDVLLTGQEKFE